MIHYLSENKFISGCGNCGRQDVALNLCSINGEMDFLCPDCFGKVNQSLEMNRQAKKAIKSNPVAGIVGAFLGALAGAVLWVLIYQLGYIAGIAGLVTVSYTHLDVYKRQNIHMTPAVYQYWRGWKPSECALACISEAPAEKG